MIIAGGLDREIWEKLSTSKPHRGQAGCGCRYAPMRHPGPRLLSDASRDSTADDLLARVNQHDHHQAAATPNSHSNRCPAFNKIVTIR